MNPTDKKLFKKNPLASSIRWTKKY